MPHASPSTVTLSATAPGKLRLRCERGARKADRANWDFYEVSGTGQEQAVLPCDFVINKVKS